MSTIQSSPPVEIAARTQGRMFAAYVVVLVLGGLAAAALTVFVYRATNSYQEAIKKEADARIAEANQKAAEANERAVQAQKELGEIQERFRPRTMSPREQNNLLGLLRSYSSLARGAREKNRETLWIVHPSGDTEATVFASMLTGLFVSAGWAPNLRAVPLSEHEVGIVILVRDRNNLPELAQALKRVLEEARIPFSLKSEPGTDERTWLIVGSKQ